jgi:hypothetical protein
MEQSLLEADSHSAARKVYEFYENRRHITTTELGSEPDESTPALPPCLTLTITNIT